MTDSFDPGGQNADTGGRPDGQFDAPPQQSNETGGTRAEGLPDWDLLPPALVRRRVSEPE